MQMGQACQLIEQARGERVLVATMGAMFAFDMLGAAQPRLSSVPLMGGAASLGLGLAIARPDVPVLVVDGDASLLMQLGGLVTVADAQVGQFLHFVVQNGTQFTGASNLPTPGGAQVDFCAMALAAGYAQAHRYELAAELQAALPALLQASGPVFVTLVVQPELSRISAQSPQPEMPDRQFQRMALEAEQLGTWLASRAEHAP